MVGATEFVFLNQRRQLKAAEEWNGVNGDRLWLYNLHYFDDLNAENAAARTPWHRPLIDRWISENPPGRGAGWEPYPASIRVVNWIKWALAGNTLEPVWRESLAIQVRWISRRLEYHLLGNHLFTNAKALVFAGLFFDGAEAGRWLKTGLETLGNQMPDQILSDGGQFERSPMYHALALEDVLDLINVSGIYHGCMGHDVLKSWHDAAAQMLSWLRNMCHPDGEIALFNDAAFGIAASLRGLEVYAASLQVIAPPIRRPIAHLSESGYVRAELGQAIAFLDVAPIGPDYLPAHGHADTLSFELSLFGERWVVDSGCSRYDSGSERLRQRGTAAHNTVVVDGQDSSEVWSSFRVARRARVLDVRMHVHDDGLRVSAAHDGYRRLGGEVIHRRHWGLQPGRFEIEDLVEGEFSRADAYLHLHPEISVEQGCATSATLRRGGVTVRLECDGGTVAVEQTTWHPQFGLELPNTRIRLRFQGARLLTRLAWT